MHWSLPCSKAMFVSTQLVACGPPYAFGLAPLELPFFSSRDRYLSFACDDN
jgi:hypothetical protein